MPRLAYADWLDENKADGVPSPARGPSAHAELIRVQCRLAAGAFSDPDYAELLDREADLLEWLKTYTSLTDLALTNLDFYPDKCEPGDWGALRRGFPEILEFDGYLETPEETVEAISRALGAAFAACPARTLRLEDPMADELAMLLRQPIVRQLHGLYLDGLDDAQDDGTGENAVAAIARSPHLAGLKRLYLEFEVLPEEYSLLARSPYLRNLESLVLDYPPASASGLETLAKSKWFRKLRRLQLWTSSEGLRALADLPPMPHLVSLTLKGTSSASTAALRKFVNSSSFPALAHLELSGTNLSSEQVALLAKGKWPLRHLRLSHNEVRKAGAEALAKAPFASTLQVLELPACEITAGGVQALACSEALSGLRRLDLAVNPIGPGGLIALAESEHFRGLRSLDLEWTNTARGPIAARDVYRFLSTMDMPDLRHLSLSQLPVSIRGARVIAADPAFANLSQLRSGSCSLGERGTRVLVTSENLSNLVVLDVNGCKTGSGAGKLADPKVLPCLARCHLGSGVPKGAATRLRRRAAIQL